MERFVHVMPLDDVIPHEGTPHCVCGPGSELVTAVDLGPVDETAERDRVAIGWSSPAIGVIYRHYALSACHQWEAVPEA